MAKEDDNKDVIYFYASEINGHVIWKEHFEHSITYAQYQSALSILERMILETSGKSSEVDEADLGKSNILAFCGDRGEGKTSCLETICGIIGQEKVNKVARDENLVREDSKIFPNNFYVLKTIDPSFFDIKHNIVELVLGQMYAALKSKKQDECTSSNFSKIIKQFDKVKRSLKHLNMQCAKENVYDAIEELDELAAGIQLQGELATLFKMYAQYMLEGVGKDKKLVICVDDIDLNVQEAYSMVEQIRKYFANPYCIVLMSVKLDQLIDVIKTNIKKTWGDGTYSEDLLYQMAVAYVNKLIPLTNRVIMPKVENVSNKSLKIKTDGTSTEEALPIKEIVVRKIFAKTRYIFYNERNISPIVPTNLRELLYLLSLLDSMPDAKREDNSDNEQNKYLFREYFFHTWPKCLEENDRKFVESLAEYKDITSINKSVISYLYLHILDNYKKAHNIDIPTRLFNTVTNPENKAANVSVGDVFYLLNQVNTGSASVSTNRLLFFLRSFYSMKLYDLYNEVSKGEEFIYPQDEKASVVKLHRNDTLYKNTNVLQRFVNGSFFTYVPGILRSHETKGKEKYSRDYRVVNGTKILEYAKAIEQLSPDKVVKKDEKDLNSLMNKVICAELFALMTLRSIEAKDLNKEFFGFERRSVEIPYLSKYNSDDKYLLFDAMAPFYNMLNIRYAYDRVNPSLYDFCAKQNWSLLHQMIQSVYEVRGEEYKFEEKVSWEQMHLLISDAILRVSDIIPSILDECRITKREIRTSDNKSHVSALYATIRKIGFTLYPLGDSGTPHEITFGFLQPIIEVVKKNQYFADVYDFDVSAVLKKNMKDALEKSFGCLKKEKCPSKATDIRDMIKEVNEELYARIEAERKWTKILPGTRKYKTWEDVFSQLENNFDVLKEYL